MSAKSEWRSNPWTKPRILALWAKVLPMGIEVCDKLLILPTSIIWCTRFMGRSVIYEWVSASIDRPWYPFDRGIRQPMERTIIIGTGRRHIGFHLLVWAFGLFSTRMALAGFSLVRQQAAVWNTGAMGVSHTLLNRVPRIWSGIRHKEVRTISAALINLARLRYGSLVGKKKPFSQHERSLKYWTSWTRPRLLSV